MLSAQLLLSIVVTYEYVNPHPDRFTNAMNLINGMQFYTE